MSNTHSFEKERRRSEDRQSEQIKEDLKAIKTWLADFLNMSGLANGTFLNSQIFWVQFLQNRIPSMEVSSSDLWATTTYAAVAYETWINGC